MQAESVVSRRRAVTKAPRMLATRALLMLLVVVYFFLPVPVSDLIFENEFYIYSSNQAGANQLSLAFGCLFIAWISYMFRPAPASSRPRASERLANWPGLRIAYLLTIAYSIALILYGLKLRASGASREELLDGIDNFLLPGMSYLLVCASIFAVARANKIQFYLLFVIFLLVDAIFNGKIFSFLALVLFFLRVDYTKATTKHILKAFAFWGLLGVSMLALSGLSRVRLAGDDISVNAIGIAYLFGSEFLGVQASIGWAMDYVGQGYPQVFWAFGSALEEFYKSNVGHGLATSPAAFFEANFGSMAVVAGGVYVIVFALAFRASLRFLGWIAYLIVAMNFQHFLRHGIDIFMLKVITQGVFAILLMAFVRPAPQRVATAPSQSAGGGE